MAQENQSTNQEDSSITEEKKVNEKSKKEETAPKSKEDSLSVGKYLEQKRIEHGYSIGQISIETKISERIIENLEKENFQDLPKKVYLKGFVKNYCKVLKISDVQAQNLLEKNFVQEETRPNIEGRFSNHAGAESSKSKMVLIISIIFVAGLAYALFNAFKKDTPKISTKKITTMTLSSETPLHAPSNEVISSETNLSESKPEDSPSIKSEVQENEGDSEEKLDLSFRPFPASNYQIDKEKDQNFIKENFSDALLSEKSNFSQKIILKAVGGETWLAYQKDETNEVVQKILKPDQELIILSDEVSLVLGNSNVVSMYHNGKVIKVASSNGIRSLVFPISSANKYRLPLFYYDEEKNFISSKSKKE